MYLSRSKEKRLEEQEQKKAENMKYWNAMKEVPKSAQKKISGGRLSGMTDIKPQWRLGIMTATFGPIGIGWYYKIVDRWTETQNNEVSAHVQIELFVKIDGEWSMGITGIGGSMLLATEKKGQHHSDEAYKMALTDALSVAMKQIGVAADIYMGRDSDKYDRPKPKEEPAHGPKMTAWQIERFKVLLADLDRIGSQKSNQMITAIQTCLGDNKALEEDAAALIGRAEKIVYQEKGR